MKPAPDLPEHLTLENTIEIGVHVRVFLDGVEQKDVFEAHTGEGWIVRARHDADGRAFSEDGENIATDRVTGTVTAEVMTPA